MHPFIQRHICSTDFWKKLSNYLHVRGPCCPVCVQPVAVLLCPGWEKVQTVFDLLEETRLIQTLHPAIALLGVGKDEPKSVRIPKNCESLCDGPASSVPSAVRANLTQVLGWKRRDEGELCSLVSTLSTLQPHHSLFWHHAHTLTLLIYWLIHLIPFWTFCFGLIQIKSDFLTLFVLVLSQLWQSALTTIDGRIVE